MISFLKNIFKTTEKPELAPLLITKAEKNFVSCYEFLTQNISDPFRCEESEIKSGLITVVLSDYVLNWLSQAEKAGMSETDSIQQLDTIKESFEKVDKGCNWKFSQSLIGEYFERYQKSQSLYETNQVKEFGGAWLLRLCYGPKYQINLTVAKQLGEIITQS